MEMADKIFDWWASLWTRPERKCIRCETLHTYITCPWCGA